jgi:hypothetical protein
MESLKNTDFSKELERQNPKLLGLPVGYKLNIRSNKAVEGLLQIVILGQLMK